MVVSTFAFYVYNAPFAQITNGILGVGTFLLATTVALGIANERSGLSLDTSFSTFPKNFPSN